VQEALTNTIKHAAASSVHITITEERDTVHVVIADDGEGFDSAAATLGFGLMGMQERAALAGGELEIESRPEGTVVRLSLPAEHRGNPSTVHEDVA